MSYSARIKNFDFDTFLDFNLFEHLDDEEEDLFYKNRLAAVANGDMTLEQAATDIDAYITQEADRVHEVPRAYHFNLERLPEEIRGKLPLPEDDDEEENMYTTLEFWPMGGGWLSLEMAARIEGDAYIYHPASAEQLRLPPTETDLRMWNFQSAIARITALDLIDCGWISSLETILPTHSWHPEGRNDIDSDDQEWLNSKDQGWKEQFAYVAKEESVSIHAQELAGEVLEKMIGYEGEDACGL
ncbi:hypothetical protein ASPACDRAFT_1859833 [Aspergillus aculeatus ATCC 16872]|uniref:Uncharacterized protein n=1 Tax=Aspergillus aculeatus (strain ATCC 16872 / CBS 172.66 / WB 5094) TaxID=690307 RepID=A0A1L9WIZ2_ASPA1|nr:uncharacterized protein ASPACDRAFT_1859833 [Aspergillus aculeatus ATCC 16872]OJJ96087.1 hypothetical protein ASPACDRAFT_1859833 [Aspergillus aculeatus ATCC 16872]